MRWMLAVLAALVMLVGSGSVAIADAPFAGGDGHSDLRYSWNTLYVGNVNVNWYDGAITDDLGNERWFARWYAIEAHAALSKVEAMLGTNVGHDVHIYIYDSLGSMAPFFYGSIRGHPSGFLVDADTALVRSDLGHFTTSDTIRHEVAHMGIADALWSENNDVGAYRGIPAWLEEGLAQQMEYFNPTNNLSFGHLRGWAENGGYIPPVCAMWSVPDTAEDLKVFYLKSYYLVQMLLHDAGDEGMASLLAKMRGDWSFEYALNGTYNYLSDGLEAWWLEYTELDDYMTQQACS